MKMKAHRKLPVLDTAAQAYVFVWREFGTIVRLSWFPLLAASIAGFFATHDKPLRSSRPSSWRLPPGLSSRPPCIA